MIDPASDALFTVLLVVGAATFAVSGAAAAIRAGMDIVGVLALAILVAVGGGSMRDIALGDLPMWWIDEPWPLALASVIGLSLIPFRRRFRALPDSWRWVLIADAAGLAAFAVTGSSVALSQGFADWVAILMGVLTAVGGGVIRDILVNEKPAVLSGQVYASAALAGSALFVVLAQWTQLSAMSYWLPVAVVLVIRLVAIQWEWVFPLLDPTAEAPNPRPE